VPPVPSPTFETLADLEVALEQREATPPPPSTLISDSTAPLVAALEQIVISEPEMAAGSSSNAGGDGLSLYSLTAFLHISLMQ